MVNILTETLIVYIFIAMQKLPILQIAGCSIKHQITYFSCRKQNKILVNAKRPCDCIVLCLRPKSSLQLSVLHFRPDGSLSTNISGGRGQFSATPVGVERLEISLFRMVLRYWQTIISFCHNTRVWQTDRRTDRQTDRIATAIPYVALHAVAQ